MTETAALVFFALAVVGSIVVFFLALRTLPPFLSLGIALGVLFMFVVIFLALLGHSDSTTALFSGIMVVALVIGGSMAFPALRKVPQFNEPDSPDDSEDHQEIS